MAGEEMTREEIEKAAKYLGELVTPEVRHSEAIRVIIQYINAALEESKNAGKDFLFDKLVHMKPISVVEFIKIIDALKIGETK